MSSGNKTTTTTRNRILRIVDDWRRCVVYAAISRRFGRRVRYVRRRLRRRNPRRIKCDKTSVRARVLTRTFAKGFRSGYLLVEAPISGAIAPADRRAPDG